jgi:tetratricopeptide (TPR) repeat protein
MDPDPAVPQSREALLSLAVSQRQKNRIRDALATLTRLEGLHPGCGRLYEERGHCYMALNDARRAIDAFRTGVTLNPAMPASWARLEHLYRMVGDTRNGAAAAVQVARWKRSPAPVVTATGLFADGDSAAAENLLRAFLHEHGNNAEALHVLALIVFERRALDEAEGLLSAALALTPDDRAARHSYALVLIERHQYRQAHEEAQKLLKLEPGNHAFLALAANVCAGLGFHDQAVPLYRRLLANTPKAADIHLSLGHAFKALGKRDECISAYRAAAAARPDLGDAYWSLANLKTYRFSDQEIARMRAVEAAPATRLVDRYNFCFALGKAYEDRGEYAESWRHYERGNALKRSESRYRPEIVETNTRLQIEVCTREFFAAREGSGTDDSAPILILGMPRSGSTLVEQILASHSRVEGTHELTNVQQIVRELLGPTLDLEKPRYPGILAQMSRGEFRELGERYRRDTQVFRTGKPHFIDKMPNNFRHIGLIHLMLPNAKIIDVRRNPMACCFSNLKQLFGNGQEFSYSVEDIARYYRTYLELMRHWDEVLPGRVLRVWHEDVVEDLEGSVRRMLAHCGLQFESGCVEFHRTQRNVLTPSAEQVRQPIFRDGVDHWKHFEPWLGALRAALGDALKDRMGAYND